MSRRKRHQQIEDHQIEWLKHRTGYPSPEEREKIIHLREQLAFEIISLAVVRASPDDPRYRELIRKYGQEEFLRAERTFREGTDHPSRVADDATSRRDYRLRYSRFGAGLPFYTPKEMDELYHEHAISLKEIFKRTGSIVADKQTKAEKLLLMGWRDWDDITPLAVPPRPADFTCPPPASYAEPVSEILEYGADLKKEYNIFEPGIHSKWQKNIPALTRMALDPGLINGWPSESASWAPWHAIHILGLLEAWESAPALAELADFENDWLSDHLPHIWTDMGAQAEPTLWMFVETPSASTKKRALAAEGLYMMTDGNEAMENKVVRGFEKILQNTKAFNPTLNGYIISFLNNMEAVDEIYPAIEDAFEQNRVDLNIISLEDLDEFDDEYDDDEIN
ncbi:MAG: hypothetical protein HZB19_00515 [Chloroflexi bacterium]|nr:hypothetical protein [Chloroflexota bacterium]